MQRESSKRISLEIPSEVFQVIGRGYLPLNSAISHNAALLYLYKLNKRYGLDWIKQNVKWVRENLRELEDF
jgi:hypothetical protein